MTEQRTLEFEQALADLACDRQWIDFSRRYQFIPAPCAKKKVPSVSVLPGPAK